MCGSMNFRHYLWINNTKGMAMPFMSVCDFLEPPTFEGVSPSFAKIRKLCVLRPFLLRVSLLACPPGVLG